MNQKDKPNEYPITVESGVLLGSVRIVGSLPDTMSAAQSAKLESAIGTVRRGGDDGFKTSISFVISQPQNGAYNV